jgi:hypothetical protein
MLNITVLGTVKNKILWRHNIPQSYPISRPPKKILFKAGAIE